MIKLVLYIIDIIRINKNYFVLNKFPIRLLDKTYYHGTSNEEAANKILKDGYIKPGELSINDY